MWNILVLPFSWKDILDKTYGWGQALKWLLSMLFGHSLDDLLILCKSNKNMLTEQTSNTEHFLDHLNRGNHLAASQNFSPTVM